MRHKALALLSSFLCGLALTAGPANAKWREASSEHFLIYSEESPESLRKFATRLERYDAAMRYTRNLPGRDPGPANRLAIYVVPSAGAVQKLAGGRDDFIVGFYVPRASGSVAFIPRRFGEGHRGDLDPETVLLHEYAHHFLYDNYMAAYPAWFSEGFAEFFSSAKFDDDGGVGLGLPATHRSYGLMGSNPLTVEQLVTHRGERLAEEQREAIYGRGWLLTHYLTFEPSRKGQMAQYLLALNSGKTGIEAATAAFGDLKKLGKELNAYLRRPKLSYIRVAPEAIRIAPVQVRELGPGEQAMMQVKLRSKRGVDSKGALVVLTDARRIAAPFASDASVQTTLAEAEYDAGYYKEAEAAADRALASNPKAVDALIYKAMARMELASGSRDPATWKEIRRLVSAANAVDPEDPEPLILFYESYLRQGIAPTANAVQGLNYAYNLAPQDRDLRMRVARQYLVDGKSKEAREALSPIAFDPHGGTMGKVATSLIALIDRGSAADVLKEWRRLEQEQEKAVS